MAKIVLLVTSDIIADQRVHRTASTLVDDGHNVLTIGRRIKKTPKYFERPYKVFLFWLPFNSGPLFYAGYNLWAFFYLLFTRFDLLHANDLDTLLAARKICWLKGKPLIYDSHELFTEVPELINRRARKFWIWLEKRLIKGLTYCSTVSTGVAAELNSRYGINCLVIRNLPLIKPLYYSSTSTKTIIYQGALNVGRGIEKLIEAMQWLTDCNLLIVGTGPHEKKLITKASQLGLQKRVNFMGRVPLDELHSITSTANLGVSLEEDMGLNYRLALPNKLFDYLQAGLPVLASDLPEMSAIVKEYNIGQTIASDCSPHELANRISSMFDDENLKVWKENSAKAALILNWENEKEKLIDLVERALKRKS